MKKISLLIVLMVGLLFVSGCGNSKEEYNGKVFSFSYSYISEDEGSCDYNIVYNGSTLNYTAFGKSGNNTYIMKEIDKSYIDELTKFVKDNKIEDKNKKHLCAFFISIYLRILLYFYVLFHNHLGIHYFLLQ